MRRLLLVTASIAPLLLATGLAASAQPHFGGAGFRHGGGGFHSRGIGMRPHGMRPAFPAYRQNIRSGWHGGGWGWRHTGHYPYRGYRRGYPYWGAASGLAAAATLGAIATYPYEPAYPVYPAYEAIPAAEGGQCSTPVKICTLYEPAPIGIGCSCRVPGGHARGTVVGP
ncbi:hypothetical protein ASE61_07665 [Bosea sp. Root670]|uniref:hypothetical protein n=1 Tax=Bosea sp. Root670 TaxID=1736583 RepID=UPI00071582F9|nr:hypothetical protein [Bosea sp. Root670]KRE04783.1 hypothetical protein ASE61_07665 [Bosea sp. Root670]